MTQVSQKPKGKEIKADDLSADTTTRLIAT